MGHLENSAVNWYIDRMEGVVGWLVLGGLIYTAVGLVLAVCWDMEVVIGCSITHP